MMCTSLYHTAALLCALAPLLTGLFHRAGRGTLPSNQPIPNGMRFVTKKKVSKI